MFSFPHLAILVFMYTLASEVIRLLPRENLPPCSSS